MKQIVDKLNKIAKKINENVELSDRDLIIDSLDSITKAYGGTPNDSTLIVDKLDDIYNNIGSTPSGNIEITENGENINVAPYATATVNVSGGGMPHLTATITNNAIAKTIGSSEGLSVYLDNDGQGVLNTMPLAPNATVTHDFLYNSPIMGSSYECYPLGYDETITAENVSDLVNCTFDRDYHSFIITDPSESSSVTITLSGIR